MKWFIFMLYARNLKLKKKKKNECENLRRKYFNAVKLKIKIQTGYQKKKLN